MVSFQSLISSGFLKIGDGHRARHSELGHDGPIFLRAVHLQESGFDFAGVQYFRQELAERLSGKSAVPGDVVVTTKGNSIGRSGFVTLSMPSFVYSPHLSFWRSLDPTALDPWFLWYWARGPEFLAQLNALKEQTDMAPYLSLRDQRRLRISLPSIQEQRLVASLLGALDDKIELNRQMNRTLEETARALFRSWFVDFDPVVAKADGREPFGMAEELAALFPARFEESELGPIPAGWSVASVADLARYVNGRNFTKHATRTGRIVVRIAELNSGPGPSTVRSDADAPEDHLAFPDDLLFAWSGSLGIYRWQGDEALINQHIFKVICDTYPRWFVWSHLREAMPSFRAIAADKATTMGHIKRSHLSEARLALPAADVLNAADAAIRPLYDLTGASERESRTLAELRDLLLPKLLSGEIRVRQAEKMVEAML